MRVNIESVFEHLGGSLEAALVQAVREVAPPVTEAEAARIYNTFRRNAITSLPAWEHLPSEVAYETNPGFKRPPDGGISLGGGKDSPGE
jgi:hypothetical protein